MIDPTPAILAACREVPVRVRNADSGPSEFQCRECGLLAICIGESHDFVPVIGVVGGTEHWVCFLCLRRFVVTWRRGETGGGGIRPLVIG